MVCARSGHMARLNVYRVPLIPGTRQTAVPPLSPTHLQRARVLSLSLSLLATHATHAAGAPPQRPRLATLAPRPPPRPRCARLPPHPHTVEGEGEGEEEEDGEEERERGRERGRRRGKEEQREGGAG